MEDFVLTHRLEKEFASLDDTKGRRRTGMFVAEGAKCVGDLLRAGFACRYLFATAECMATLPASAGTVVTAAPALLRKLTRLQATPRAIGFFELPTDDTVPAPAIATDNLVLALDRVQDPGNLGTIIRTAEWMGVRTIVASPDTVDAFNPKTVQATMGALANVKVVYTPLPQWLGALPGGTPVYGTFLDGDNIYTAPLSPAGVLIMGNEGRGISAETAALVTSRLLIPAWPPGENTSESLNVATATAIALSQFRMRQTIR